MGPLFSNEHDQQSGSGCAVSSEFQRKFGRPEKAEEDKIPVTILTGDWILYSYRFSVRFVMVI